MSLATSSKFAYVGSFAMPSPLQSEGLHVFCLAPETGKLTSVTAHVPGLNVGNFAFDTRRGVLYVTDEVASTAEFREQHSAPAGGGGRVYAFSVSRKTGDLTELGHWPSYGTQPAGITLNGSGDFLVVSHFGSRNITTAITGNAQSGYRIEPRFDDATTVLFPLDVAGRLGEPSDIHIHTNHNSSPRSCLHSVSLSRDGSFLIECDMAKDQLVSFVVDTGARSLSLRGIFNTSYSGPRYSAFHPTLPVFYVNYEHEPIIEAFHYQGGGAFKPVGIVDVLPPELGNGPNILLSDLRLHPSGKYVYTLIRGHEAVSAFAVEEETGRLHRIQTAVLGGISPKGCVTSPDGRFLYIALSVSNEVQVWKIGRDGLLTATSERIAVPRPSAIITLDFNPS